VTDSMDGLPPAVASALDRRLAQWAAERRIDNAALATIRASVLASSARADVLRDAAPGFDADWLWSLLRPVTDLIDRTEDTTEFGRPRRFAKWMEPFVGNTHYQPYLQLA
jgi:hypothetical protein